MEQLGEHRHHPPGPEPPRHYIHDAELIGKIFPLGLDPGKEHFARAVATKYGYGNLCDLDNGEIAEVDINAIFPCQSIINKTRLIELMIYLRDNEVPGYPMGIKVGNEVYLLDGHHRVSAQILMGKKTVMMHLSLFNEDDEIVEQVRNPKPINFRHHETTIGTEVAEADLHHRHPIH